MKIGWCLDYKNLSFGLLALVTAHFLKCFSTSRKCVCPSAKLSMPLREVFLNLKKDRTNPNPKPNL